MDVQWLDETERTAWLTLVRASGRLADELERDLSDQHGLLLGDYEILASLSHAGRAGLRMGDLAEGLMVSRSRLTHRVNRLEQQGLVCREACETDRRGAFAVLTAEGRARLEAAAPTHVAGLREHLVERLDRAELLAMTAALAKVLEGLGEQPPRGIPEGIGSPACLPEGIGSPGR